MEILKFETKTCMPCKFVDSMLQANGLSVDRKIDIEEDEATRVKYDVMKAPTVMLIDDEGNEVKRVMGIDEEGILELFKLAGK